MKAATSFLSLVRDRAQGKILCVGRDGEEICLALGAQCRAVPTGKIPEGPWDTIVLAGALELAAEPWAMLLHGCARLREGGLLIVLLPNGAYGPRLESLLTGTYRAGDEARIFTPGFARDMIERAGLTVEEIHRDANPCGESQRLAQVLDKAGLLTSDLEANLAATAFAVIARKL